MQQNELISKFGFPIPGFSSPIKWLDGFGFSVVQEYGDGYASLYKFGTYDKENKDGDLKKLWISVSYGKQTSDGGISLGTGKKGLWNPVDLNFHDEYFFNQVTGKFFHLKKQVDPKNIFLQVEKIHKLPTKPIKGILIRARLYFWRIFLPSLITAVDWSLKLLLLIISGERPKEGDILKRLISQWRDGRTEQANQKPAIRETRFEPVSFNKGSPLSFFGYEAKRWSVVFYCLVTLIFYLVFFYSKINTGWMVYVFKPFSHILKNSFLALCYVVVSFSFTEAFLPYVLENAIESIPKVFSKISFKILKVNTFW